MSPSTALVTGTSGYLGARIAEDLAREGFRVLERRSRHDVADIGGFEPPASVGVLVHSAFTVDFSPASSHDGESESVRNTRRVTDWAAARGVPHLVFLSAAAVLGVSATPRARNEDDVGDTDPTFEAYRATRYVRDKLACERLLAGYPGAVTTLYLTTVYGAGLTGPAAAALARLSGRGPVALVPPGGTSFLDLRDLLEGLTLVIARRTAGAFVLSSGNVTYRQLARAAATVSGRRRRVLVLPRRARPLIERLAPLRPGLAPSLAILSSSFGFKYYSCERARRTLGFQARHALPAALESARSPR